MSAPMDTQSAREAIEAALDHVDLSDGGHWYADGREALSFLVAKIEELENDWVATRLLQRAEAAEAERDRLRAALEEIAKPDELFEQSGGAFGPQAFKRVQQIARTVLSNPTATTEPTDAER